MYVAINKCMQLSDLTIDSSRYKGCLTGQSFY